MESKVSADEIMANLSSPDRSIRSEAVRRLKNRVIGSKQRKTMFLARGAVPKLCELLLGSDAEIAAHAASALGSFAHGSEEHVRQVCTPDVIQTLTASLFSEDEAVVASCCRSLKIFYQTGVPDPDSLLQSCGDPVGLLVGLLSRSEAAAESAASLLVCCCQAEARRQELLQAGGIEALLKLLCGPPLSCSLYASLSAIAELSARFPDFAECLVAERIGPNHYHASDLATWLGNVMRDDRSSVRLLAATVLANLVRHRVPGHQFIDTHHVCVSLVKLTHDNDPHVRARAARVLAVLLGACEYLHDLGQHDDIIKHLVAYFTPHKTDDLDAAVIVLMKEGALAALAALCSRREENRRTVLQTDVLQHVVACLQDPVPSVRAAAANCARSLSRSVKTLRTALMDAGIAVPLYALLNDTHSDVQTAACGALCNMVMEFAPMKKVIVDRGGVRRLVEIVRDAPLPLLKLNAVWALKNLLYDAESGESLKTKREVMACLGADQLLGLLDDPSADLQEQALGLLRNLVYGTHADIDLVTKGCGGTERILTALVRHMDPTRSVKTASQALFVVSNIATGGEDHKASIIARGEILQMLLRALQSDAPTVIVPALWAVINLSWKGDPGAQQRALHLRGLGFVDAVVKLTHHTSQDVQERVKTALELLQTV